MNIWTSKQPWIRRPSGTLVLDRDSELAKGLVRALPLWEPTPREIASNVPLTLAGTKPEVDTRYGTRFTGAGAWYSTVKGSPVTAFPFSVSTRVLVSTDVSETQCAGLYSTDGSYRCALHATGVVTSRAGIRFRFGGGYAIVDGDPNTSQGLGPKTLTEVHASATDHRLYINGILILSSSVDAGSSFTGFTGFQVGYSSVAPTYYQNGWLEWVLIHNRALSVGEIKTLHNSRTQWELYQRTPQRWYLDLYVPGGGGSPYSMTAETGLYTLTGQAAGLRAGRKLILDTGAYTATGQTAGLKAGRKITADAGTYTVTGQNTILLAARKIVAAPGTYTLSGQTTGLFAGRKIIGDTGTYTFSGQDAVLRAARKLTAEVGTYTFTGIAANLVYTPIGGPDYSIICETGTYTFTGIAANLLAQRKLIAETATYTLSGQNAGVRAGRKIVASPGVYTFTGQNATTKVARKLVAETGAYVFTGLSVTFYYSGAPTVIPPDQYLFVSSATPSTLSSRLQGSQGSSTVTDSLKDED